MVNNYKNQQIYIQVVKHCSITKAADILGISKSSVSRTLAQLEQQWRAQLLIRSTRNIFVTDAGKAVYLHFIKIIEDAKQTQKILESATENISGIIKLTAPETFAGQFLSPIIYKFLQQHCAIKIELIVSSDYEHLIEQGFDLAFRIGELEDSSLKARQLYKTKLALFASKNYLTNRQEKFTSLGAHNCLIFTGMPMHNQWLRALGVNDFSSIEGNVSSNNESFLIELAKQGQGVLLFPEFLLKNYLLKGELEQIMNTYSSSISINAIYPHTDKLSGKIRLFLDFVMQELNN